MKLECVHIVSGIIREVLCSECLKHFVFKEITRYIYSKGNLISDFMRYLIILQHSPFCIRCLMDVNEGSIIKLQCSHIVHYINGRY